MSSTGKALEEEVTNSITEMCSKARDAWFFLSNLPEEKRNEILRKIALQISEDKEQILESNRSDIENARSSGLSEALVDRLTLTEKRFSGILDSLEQVATLPDPLGISLGKKIRPNGLKITKVSVPIGVIGMVYESRPNVTVEAAALAIKSGNAIILKGGKEAFCTNFSLAASISSVLEDLQYPLACVSFIPVTDRLGVQVLLKQEKTVDVIIPRGGEGLIRYVTEHSLIPVIKHYKGLCHTYIDKKADPEKAISIAFNAKMQRPGVCNAMETLLIHEDIVHLVFHPLVKKYKEAGVVLKGCELCLEGIPSMELASSKDWETEYLDKTLSIKIVPSLKEAVHHIEQYGSRHSECIVTEDKVRAARFSQNVDASAVFVNASTRFNDGFEFGLGAEMGISTDKLHARGPMGVRELTTYKYFVLGEGHVRE